MSSGVPANGSFDFEFLLFDSLAGGTQIGTTITRNGVPVANGIFGVKLDFGPSFPGANRFLEIRVQQMGGGLTLLTPRQPVSSTPYSIKSISAASADSVVGVLGVANGGTGIGPAFPPANTYLRSNGAGWQAAGIQAADVPSNISVSAGNITGVLGPSQGGTGIGPTLPFTGAFLRSNGTGWQATGITSNDIPSGSTSYIQNTPGQQASSNFNISGDGTAGGTLSGQNVAALFEYRLAGQPFMSAVATNTRVGVETGSPNLGGGNTYAGYQAGAAATSNTSNNSYFGNAAGKSNNFGSSNAFFGGQSGALTTFGGSNAFFGYGAGNVNISGSNNTAIGFDTNVGTNLTNATAVGASATVAQSNSLVLGNPSISVGIGTSAPKAKLHVAGGNIYVAGSANGIILASPNGSCYKLTVLDDGALTTGPIACP